MAGCLRAHQHQTNPLMYVALSHLFHLKWAVNTPQQTKNQTCTIFVTVVPSNAQQCVVLHYDAGMLPQYIVMMLIFNVPRRCAWCVSMRCVNNQAAASHRCERAPNHLEWGSIIHFFIQFSELSIIWKAYLIQSDCFLTAYLSPPKYQESIWYAAE